jgi:hypothetical protein
MRYLLDETWADIGSTVSFLAQRRNAAHPMDFQLQSLLDLRRDAEGSAKRQLALAAAELLKQQEEHARLAARWQATCATLQAETARLASGPGPRTAEQGQAREGYLRRLRDEADRLKAVEDEHRATLLAASESAHKKAVSDYEAATREREAVSKIEERARAASAKTAARRAEQAASDLAMANRRGR